MPANKFQMTKSLSSKITVLPRSLLLLVSSFAICHSSFAVQPLTVTLVSEVTSIQPGQPFHVGLHLHHAPAHHSYWKQPGIVGVAPSMSWNLPPGFAAGEIEWPAPERILMFKIKAQGYERDVVLPIQITPPAGLKPGAAVALSGRCFWMSCDKVCNPGFTDVTLTLPVNAGPPAADPKWKPLFDQERARFAKPSESWSAAAVEKGQTVTLTLKPAADQARNITGDAEAKKIIFFTDDGYIHTDKPQSIELRTDGSIQITLTKAELYLKDKPPEKLDGIVWNESGWMAGGQLQSMTIQPKLQRQ